MKQSSETVQLSVGAPEWRGYENGTHKTVLLMGLIGHLVESDEHPHTPFM